MSLHDADAAGADLTPDEVRALEAALARAEEALRALNARLQCCPSCGGPLPRSRPSLFSDHGIPAGLQTRAEGDGPQLARRYSMLGEVAVDESVRTFEGYAVRWGVMNSYREIFMPGAFRATLAKPPMGRKASMYLQHQYGNVIGEWTELREDDIGLFVRGRFVKSSVGDHALALVREKLVTGLSIGFVEKASRVENADDWKTRIVHVEEADLYEVSLVENPSDKTAGVTAVRTVRPDMSVREIESVLASIDGMPRDVAKAMAGRWKPKAGEERDAPGDVGEVQERDAPASEAADRAEAEAMSRLIALLRT